MHRIITTNGISLPFPESQQNQCVFEEMVWISSILFSIFMHQCCVGIPTTFEKYLDNSHP